HQAPRVRVAHGPRRRHHRDGRRAVPAVRGAEGRRVRRGHGLRRGRCAMTSRTYRVGIDPKPIGAVVEPSLDHYQDFLRDVFTLLAERPDLWDDLVALTDGPAVTNAPHLTDKPSRDDDLAARIVDALPEASTELRVDTQHLTAMYDRIGRILNRLPGQ